MKYPADPPTPAEVRKMITVANTRYRSGRRARALLAVMAYSGLRVSEALALRIQDYSRENGTLRVLRGKGRKARTAALAVQGVRHLDAWIDSLGSAAPDAFIFHTATGRPMATAHVRRLLKTLAERAGVRRRMHPHACRHFFAVESIRRGMRINVLSRLLGHSRSAVTSVYVDSLSPEDALASARDVWADDA